MATYNQSRAQQPIIGNCSNCGIEYNKRTGGVIDRDVVCINCYNLNRTRVLSDKALRDEFKKLRLIDGSEAEGVLQDGTLLSDYIINKLSISKTQTLKQVENILSKKHKHKDNPNHNRDEIYCCIECHDDRVMDNECARILSTLQKI
jgi:hypothetical protein